MLHWGARETPRSTRHLMPHTPAFSFHRFAPPTPWPTAPATGHLQSPIWKKTRDLQRRAISRTRKKGWELSTTKPGTIAARRELSTTAKKHTKHRKILSQNYGSRATAGPPPGMTMVTLRSAPMWRHPRLEKRACLAMKDGHGLSSYKTCSEKKCPKCSWPSAFGTHRKASAIDTATRQRGTQTGTGRRSAPMQRTIPAPPTSICRPLANGIGLPVALYPWPPRRASPPLLSHMLPPQRSINDVGCRSEPPVPECTRGSTAG